MGTLTDRLFETIQKPVLYLLAPIRYLSLSHRHSLENEHSAFLGCGTDPFWTTSHNVLSGSDEDMVAPLRESENTVAKSHLHTLGGWDS